MIAESEGIFGPAPVSILRQNVQSAIQTVNNERYKCVFICIVITPSSMVLFVSVAVITPCPGTHSRWIQVRSTIHLGFVDSLATAGVPGHQGLDGKVRRDMDRAVVGEIQSVGNEISDNGLDDTSFILTGGRAKWCHDQLLRVTDEERSARSGTVFRLVVAMDAVPLAPGRVT